MASPAEKRLRISARAALGGGIILPVLETIRRWKQLGDLSYLINWIDDYLIGAILVWAAVKAIRDHKNGRAWLAAAWGFACGMAFSSFIFQVQHTDAPDPSSVSGAVVATMKGVMLLIAIFFLGLTLRPDDGNR